MANATVKPGNLFEKNGGNFPTKGPNTNQSGLKRGNNPPANKSDKKNKK
jgi:hypothetical protein